MPGHARLRWPAPVSWELLADWGTSRLRLFRVADGAVVERRDGPGIAALSSPPETVLREALASWRDGGLPASIRMCGMVGSRNGWIEVPYAECPGGTASWRAAAAHTQLDGVPVTIAAGLACRDGAGRPDVMRGEETQLFGALALDPTITVGRRTVALPGTHSKWARLADGSITRFRTCLTGELFALLRDRSTLLSVGPDDALEDEGEGFALGVARAGAEAALLGLLFEARSAQLRDGRSGSWARGFLSGLLIGCEIMEARMAGDCEDGITLIGDESLVDRYLRACALLAVPADRLDGEACVLAGLALLEA